MVENLSNLTISGRKSGSLIECFAKSTFGFHLKNAANVTLTRLQIQNCGSIIPSHLLQYINETMCYQKYLPSSPPHLTFFLIETSRQVSLSGVHIEHAPGIAVTVTNYATHEMPKNPINDGNSNLRLSDDIISHSREMFVMMESLILERTVITNSCAGIVSNRNIIMKNVEFINCILTSVIGGHVLVRESLTMRNSALYIQDQSLHISGGRILFYGYDPQVFFRLYASNCSLLTTPKWCSETLPISTILLSSTCPV